MEMSGEHRIPAPRQTVWEALNDADVLKASIPGCEEIEKTSDTGFNAKVRAKVGPVNARFAGGVTLENLNPPESYTIRGEGKGGPAGFAKGSADVSLEEAGEETILRYKAQADIGGKLAQLGSRLVQGTANKYAQEFFTNFSNHVAGAQAGAAAAAQPEPAAEPEPAAASQPAPAPESAPEPQPAAASASQSEPAPSRPEPAAQPQPQTASGRSGSSDSAGESTGESPGSDNPLAKPMLWGAIIVVLIVLALLMI